MPERVQDGEAGTILGNDDLWKKGVVAVHPPVGGREALFKLTTHRYFYAPEGTCIQGYRALTPDCGNWSNQFPGAARRMRMMCPLDNQIQEALGILQESKIVPTQPEKDVRSLQKKEE